MPGTVQPMSTDGVNEHRRRWFTSDLHFGHANILRYCDRPFAGVEEMNDWLVEAWNETVATQDEVWVLGDVAMGKLDVTLDNVGRLNGRIRLLVGNHDRPFDQTGEALQRWEARYLDAGFTSIHHGTTIIDLGGVEVLLSHFPYTGDSRQEDRFAERRPADTGGWLLHGHVHEVWRQRGRMLNVGVDAWGGRPVGERALVGLIAEGPAERSPLPWR
jgi:calcineurin-like phosphoesterase family protein